MCGIAGIYHLNGKQVDLSLLNRMADIMKHRGPDDAGSFVNGRIGFAHRRLSIIDLSPKGHQPMSNEEQSIWITYNGEVYNYLELKSQLEAKGYRFKSRTDTEVILHAYAEWGEECLNKFNGMFAFAIWDGNKQKLFCARDRFGIKPFYYCLTPNTFCFASEIKALLELNLVERAANNNTIYDYLVYGYEEHNEDTFFRQIKKLCPAHYLIIENGKVSIKRYWDLEPNNVIETNPNAKYDTRLAQEFYALLEDSIKLRLRSDVPVGTCLSGGLDSSSIVCIVNNLLLNANQSIDASQIGARQKTFSACWEDKRFDEREFIESVIEKTGAESHYTFPDGNQLFDIIEKVIWHQEEPFRSTSILAQWYVMELARENEVKVLLDGQGADEILAGYHRYYGPLFAEFLRNFQIRTALYEMKHYSSYHSHSKLTTLQRALTPFIPDKFLDLMKQNRYTWLHPDFVKSNHHYVILPHKYKSYFNNELYQVLTASTLPALLRYEDKNSMAFSIEARVPFLDYRLVEFMFSLPGSQKIRAGITKFVLRNAMQGILPEKIRMRTDKIGFSTPEDAWFRTKVKKQILEVINSRSFKERGYFNSDGAIKAFREHCEGRENLSSTIWHWINLELWFRIFFS